MPDLTTIERDEAQKLLAPYLSTLEECFAKAWEEWTTFYAPQHHILDPRARAAIVYCHLRYLAAQAFASAPNAVCGVRKGIFFLFIGDKIKLRFKKANQKGVTSNISTRQQMRLELQMEIPGMEQGTMLNACYQLDALQAGIEKQMITLQYKRRVKWDAMGSLASDGGLVMTPQPPSPGAPPSATLKDGLAPKKPKKENG